jgi:hypothetical protein
MLNALFDEKRTKEIREVLANGGPIVFRTQRPKVDGPEQEKTTPYGIQQSMQGYVSRYLPPPEFIDFKTSPSIWSSCESR